MLSKFSSFYIVSDLAFCHFVSEVDLQVIYFLSISKYLMAISLTNGSLLRYLVSFELHPEPL